MGWFSFVLVLGLGAGCTGEMSAGDGAMPGEDGSMPGDDGSTPGDDGSTPGEDGSTPGDDASMPGPDTAPPPGPDPMPPVGCPGPDAPIAEPYAWYPSLDLARIPFHTGAGEWGAQRPVEAPMAPTTTRRITVTTGEELAREALVPGSEITVTADIPEQVVLFGDVVDVDLIIPPDVTLGNLLVGRAVPPGNSERVRIRGPVAGSHSGGQLGQVTFFGAHSDVILDGVDLNGAGGENMGFYIAAEPANRFAIVNNRSHTLASTSLMSHVTNLVIAGNSFLAGAGSRESNGNPAAWSLRGGQRLVVFDNRIEGNRYHRVRVHPSGAPDEYVWIADNVLVDPYEARILWAATLGDGPERWGGFWAVCNTIYAHSDTSAGCLGASVDAASSRFVRITNNEYFGTMRAEDQRRFETGGADYTSDSTFSSWQEPPAWGGPGDPHDVPLPRAADPLPQDASCPGPG